MIVFVPIHLMVNRFRKNNHCIALNTPVTKATRTKTMGPSLTTPDDRSKKLYKFSESTIAKTVQPIHLGQYEPLEMASWLEEEGLLFSTVIRGTASAVLTSPALTEANASSFGETTATGSISFAGFG